MIGGGFKVAVVGVGGGMFGVGVMGIKGSEQHSLSLRFLWRAWGIENVGL